MFYDPFYTMLKFNPAYLFVLGARATGKTWGVSHYVSDYIRGKTAIIVRNARQIKDAPRCSPFYWDETVTRKGCRLYRNGEEIGAMLSLDRVKTDDCLNVVYSDYVACDFSGYKSVIFDECNMHEKPGDANRFAHVLRCISMSEQFVKVFVTLNFPYGGCDVAAMLGFPLGQVKFIEKGQPVCKLINGVKVAFEIINDIPY